jgi:hypothetical protein
MRIFSSTRDALSACFAFAVLAGCGATTGGLPTTSAVDSSLGIALSGSGPTIKHVSAIEAEQNQKIVIKGKGFGTTLPFNGNSCCLEFIMNQSGPGCYWTAGGYDNEVTLNVTHWSDQKIVIKGFTGAYGGYGGCWTLYPSDAVTIEVWNFQTKAGPATWNTTVR